ncbi:MAG: hypothetical protein ABFC94_13150, partial [Syntrophomonas sp.]
MIELNLNQLNDLSNPSTLHSTLHAGKAALAVFEPDKTSDGQQEQVMEAGRVFSCVFVQMLEQLNRIEQ